MDYITSWFPFTVEEVAVAFEAGGLDRSEALRLAKAMSEDMTDASKGETYGGMEVGSFLDPIAELSEDAARRVAAFRSGRSFERGWDSQESNGA